MPDPADLLYAATHEWVRIEGDIATVGISRYAQDELGAITLVLLPEVGRIVQQGDKFGEIEGIYTVSDLYAPVSGQVIEVNYAPCGDTWMLKIKRTQPADTYLLLGSADYHARMIGPTDPEKEIISGRISRA